MSPFLSFVRRLRPVDVLLPIGAALVSAGLQNLADREARQRVRLDELAELAGDHIDALMLAGVNVPEQLYADEKHPLDPGVPWLAMHASSAATGDEQEPEPAPKRKPWKLAALGLAAAAGVTLWNNRDEIAQRIGETFGYPYGADGPVAQDLAERAAADKAWGGDRCTSCDQPAAWFRDEQEWRHLWPDGAPRWSSHTVTLPAAVNESNAAPTYAHDPGCNTAHEGAGPCPPAAVPDECVGAPDCGHNAVSAEPVAEPDAVSGEPVDEPDAVSITPREECVWPNCDWTSDPRKSAQGQAVQAAVHRNRCMYRPAGAGVTPA